MSGLPFEAWAEGGPLGLLVALALGTLISEDASCVAAGLFVAKGTLGLFAATTACCLGILVGDLGLYYAGRALSRVKTARPPLSWIVSAGALVKGRAWFARHGPKAVVLSRFLPGTRLPTYVAAGFLGVPLPAFTLSFVPAAVVWTILLVGATAVSGAVVLKWLESYERYALIGLVAVALTVLVGARGVAALATSRGRRLLVSRWRRLTRWEFWPAWLVNLPVLGQVARLGLRHRSLSLFTAANPAIPAGGFVLESKSRILTGLAASPGAEGRVAVFALLPKESDLETRLDRLRAWLAEHGLAYPVVLKPDVGERGEGVAVVRNESQAEAYLADSRVDVIAQEHVAGLEYGVFYLRFPHAERGEIFSITEKTLPTVTGDGERSLEELILADEREVCNARLHLERHRDQLDRVPAAGETVVLGELGNHCRGATFRDGGHLLTPRLTEAVDEVSRGFEGFYFGRFDLRVPSREDFQAGRNWKVLELNGVTSEATHIYHPGSSLWSAWRVLFRQWELAFAIGAQNVERGARPVTVRALVRLLLAWRRGTSLPPPDPHP